MTDGGERKQAWGVVIYPAMGADDAQQGSWTWVSTLMGDGPLQHPGLGEHQ